MLYKPLWLRPSFLTNLKMGARHTLGDLFKQRFLDFNKLRRFNHIQYFFQLPKEHDLEVTCKTPSVRCLIKKIYMDNEESQEFCMVLIQWKFMHKIEHEQIRI